MKEKGISKVGAQSGHFLMAVPDSVIMFYSYIFPCLDPKRGGEAEDSLHGESSSGHWPSSPGPSPTAGRFHDSPLRTPPSPLRAPLSPYRLNLSPQQSRKEPLNITLSQIYKITQNFSKDHMIGEGGFGSVYKAELSNGQTVAIKRGKKEKFGALRAEFRNEVALLTQIEHKNLVQLLGYIDEANEQLIITEYVPNGTLREHLDGARGGILKFSQRLGIAIDIAHGLTYLHNYAEKPIIHRDVKSSNIMLTNTLRAKVADFGFARTGPTKEGQSHVSTNIKGTAGYVDPDYLRTFHLSPKSDVFSFGILLLEIISGRRPVEITRAKEEKITIRWAFSKYDEGYNREILDPELHEEVPDEALRRILSLAFQCAAPYRRDRPNMREVCEQLWKIRKDYNA
ncbi:Nodulation receptor kinase-like protein [Rhynchospora pubera]|uniref:non-specific serine/threonine protein kinase n=1 Tax=Rhynchospora pubera TaxID=906938 RepID=A0AAV8FP38_9POAL|nr:Nodulation receptor kinase-like protein [Rhynchospora pubera]